MGLTSFGSYAIEDTVDFAVYVPKTEPCFAASLAVVPLQLMGYYVSVAKGLDVDKPRKPCKNRSRSNKQNSFFPAHPHKCGVRFLSLSSLPLPHLNQRISFCLNISQKICAILKSRKDVEPLSAPPFLLPPFTVCFFLGGILWQDTPKNRSTRPTWAPTPTATPMSMATASPPPSAGHHRAQDAAVLRQRPGLCGAVLFSAFRLCPFLLLRLFAAGLAGHSASTASGYRLLLGHPDGHSALLGHLPDHPLL